MLKKFIYLNESSLDSYLSSLEDGLRNSAESRATTSGTVKGGVNARVVTLDGENGHGSEEKTSRIDTPEARYERLDQLMRSDPERSGWVDITDPDTDLKDIGVGALVEVECEIFIPDFIKMLSPSGQLEQTVAQIETLAKLAPLFGSKVDNLPNKDQLDAMKGISGALGSDAMLIGEPNDSEWTLAGKLSDSYLHGEVEGYARVVGKISTRWGKGTWKPLLALPGMNLLPRDQRREMERKGPDEGQEKNWLEGPAIMLDVLAIYR